MRAFVCELIRKRVQRGPKTREETRVSPTHSPLSSLRTVESSSDMYQKTVQLSVTVSLTFMKKKWHYNERHPLFYLMTLISLHSPLTDGHFVHIFYINESTSPSTPRPPTPQTSVAPRMRGRSRTTPGCGSQGVKGFLLGRPGASMCVCAFAQEGLAGVLHRRKSISTGFRPRAAEGCRSNLKNLG